MLKTLREYLLFIYIYSLVYISLTKLNKNFIIKSYTILK